VSAAGGAIVMCEAAARVRAVRACDALHKVQSSISRGGGVGGSWGKGEGRGAEITAARADAGALSRIGGRTTEVHL